MKQSKQLKVRILMPAYNYAEYIGEAIESILGYCFHPL